MSKHRATKTMIASNKANEMTGLYITEENMVMELLREKGTALCCRQIHDYINEKRYFEMTSASRTCTNLQNKGLIAVAFEANSPKTGVRVQFYAIKNAKPENTLFP